MVEIVNITGVPFVDESGLVDKFLGLLTKEYNGSTDQAALHATYRGFIREQLRRTENE